LLFLKSALQDGAVCIVEICKQQAGAAVSKVVMKGQPSLRIDWEGSESLELAEASAGIGVWDMDLATGLVRGRPQFFRVMGLEPRLDPVSVEVFRALRHPEDRAKVKDGFRQILAEGTDYYESEYRILRPDGQLRWILGRGRVVRDDHGRPVRYFGVDMDITDRKRVEAALRAAEARFLRIFQLAPVAMSISTLRDGRYVDVNAALLSQTGYTREEVVGRTARDLRVYVDEKDFTRVRGILAEKGVVQSLEIALRGKHEVLTVLINADVVEFGGEQCLLTASVDITHRKAVEAALIHSEQRYRALIDNANDIVSTMDLEFRFNSINPAVERILGYTPEEIVGAPLQRFIPPDQLPMHRQMLQRKLQGAPATRYEMQLVGKTGARFTVEVNSRLIFDDAGAPVGIHSIARDVTERKDAEARQALLVRELQHRAKNLLAVMQSITSSTLSASSDLQTAHDTILGRLQALARAQDFIASGPSGGVPIDEIVRGELGLFVPRVSVDGPQVLAGSGFAQMFAVVVHELATNATKYGSLSHPDGLVDVKWEIRGDSTFTFSWIERRGPPVYEPISRGFGSRLMRAALSGNPRIVYAKEGLEYSISLPLEEVCKGS
jgi:PAS domain S-box-containing protein